MNTTTDHILIRSGTLADMLTEIAAALPCEDCTGEPAICVEGPEEWELVDVHDTSCPASRWSQRHNEENGHE